MNMKFEPISSNDTMMCTNVQESIVLKKEYNDGNINCSKGATFNVMQSSEISKVLRELTQCVASERDLFVPDSIEASWDGACLTSCIVSRSDISCSELSGSTTTNCSLELVPEKNFIGGHVCGDCGKHFTKKDFLQKHRIVHEEPRHRCVVCEKSFVREDKLKRHFVSIHSKHRPHVCTVCAKAFARKDKLKDHQKHHITASNSFLCAECHVPFVQKSDLNRHTRAFHKGEDCVTSTRIKVESSICQDSTVDSGNVVMAMSTTFLPLTGPPRHNEEQHMNKTRRSRPKKAARQSNPSVALPSNIPTSVNMSSDSPVGHRSLTLVPTLSNQVLYPHLPIITQFKSPAMSVFPGLGGHYSSALTSSASSLPSDSGSFASLMQYSSSSSSSSQFPTSHAYHGNIEPNMISTVFSLTSENNGHLKPNVGSVFLAQQNVCQLQQSPLRYCPNMQTGPDTLGHTNARPLTTNIYPYMPF